MEQAGRPADPSSLIIVIHPRTIVIHVIQLVAHVGINVAVLVVPVADHHAIHARDEPKGPRCVQAGMTTDAKPRRVTVDELDELVEAEENVLAEFYSRSCPACDAQEPILGGVAREYEGVVAMVDPGEDFSALDEYGIRSTPSFVRFQDGEAAGTLADGVVGADRLLAFARTGAN